MSVSPLGAFFYENGGTESALENWQYQTQEIIAACMAADGFKFAVAVAPEPAVFKERAEMGLERWTELYGYGISTSVLEITQSQSDNLNNQHLLTLTEPEQKIYLRALYGDVIASGLVEVAADLPPLEEQGCAGAAMLETGGSVLTDGLEAFNQAYLEGSERIAVSSAMIDAQDAWASCMIFQGYEFKSSEEARLYVKQQFEDATVALADPELVLSMDQLERLLDRDTSKAGISVEGFDPNALSQVNTEELEIARTDLECYQRHVSEVFEPLRDELELGLLDTYQEQLEAIRRLTG